MIDPIIGNVSRSSIRSNQQTVDVITRNVGGAVLPYKILLNGKSYTITQVLGSRKDHHDTEYGIKIGAHRTKLWRRSDGSWYVVMR